MHPNVLFPTETGQSVEIHTRFRHAALGCTPHFPSPLTLQVTGNLRITQDKSPLDYGRTCFPVVGILLSIQNLFVYSKILRQKHACSFKFYDWSSTTFTIASLADLALFTYFFATDEKIAGNTTAASRASDWFLLAAYVLLGLFVFRLMFTFSYHLAVEEFYCFGEFSETQSEHALREALERKKKRVIKEKLRNYREEKGDLFTVKESANEHESKVHILPSYDEPKHSVPKFPQSCGVVPGVWKFTEVPEEKSSEYHSFNLK